MEIVSLVNLVLLVLLVAVVLWMCVRMSALENRLIRMDFAFTKLEEKADHLRDIELLLNRILHARAQGTHTNDATEND